MTRTRAGRIAIRYAARLAVVLLLAALVIRVSGAAESAFFYVPTRADYETPEGVEDVAITTPDGLRLAAWYLPPRGRADTDPPAPAVLFCHGNAGLLPNHLSYASFLAERGMGVLIFDYRSFGKSARGRLVRENLAIDTEAAYQALRARKDVDPSRIGVYGFSLGGTFAIGLAAAHPEIRAVCSAAAFSSWGGVAGDHFPIIGHVLVDDGIDSADLAGRLGQRPLLIVHAEGDRTVDVRHARVLEAAARDAGTPVTSLLVPGPAHSGLIARHPEVPQAIGGFFAEHLAPR